jgi:nucleotide sugar dehydrogenase
MAHYPGIGVGGHCIPVDPYYLIEYARGNGFEHHFLSLARKINENMPIYAIDAVEQSLIQLGQGNLDNKRVTLLGLSYKANVGDDRESPSKVLISELSERGVEVTTYDPYFIEKSTAKSLDEALNNKDAVFLVTSHDEFKNIEVNKLKTESVFYDGRNMFIDKQNLFLESRINYIGVGI